MSAAADWLAAYAARVGAPPPTDVEVTTVLELAAVAAHASERKAAPVACWLAARHGLSAEEALAMARGTVA